MLDTSHGARLAQAPLRPDSRYALIQNPLALGQGCAVFVLVAVDQSYHGDIATQAVVKHSFVAGGDCPLLAYLCQLCPTGYKQDWMHALPIAKGLLVRFGKACEISLKDETKIAELNNIEPSDSSLHITHE